MVSSNRWVVNSLCPSGPAEQAYDLLTAALLDRLAHKAHTLEFVGESYRFRQRMEQETQPNGGS